MLKVWLVIYVQTNNIGYYSHPYENLYLCYSDIDQILSKDHIDPNYSYFYEKMYFSCESAPTHPILK